MGLASSHLSQIHHIYHHYHSNSDHCWHYSHCRKTLDPCFLHHSQNFKVLSKTFQFLGLKLFSGVETGGHYDWTISYFFPIFIININGIQICIGSNRPTWFISCIQEKITVLMKRWCMFYPGVSLWNIRMTICLALIVSIIISVTNYTLFIITVNYSISDIRYIVNTTIVVVKYWIQHSNLN